MSDLERMQRGYVYPDDSPKLSSDPEKAAHQIFEKWKKSRPDVFDVEEDEGDIKAFVVSYFNREIKKRPGKDERIMDEITAEVDRIFGPGESRDNEGVIAGMKKRNAVDREVSEIPELDGYAQVREKDEEDRDHEDAIARMTRGRHNYQREQWIERDRKERDRVAKVRREAYSRYRGQG